MPVLRTIATVAAALLVGTAVGLLMFATEADLDHADIMDPWGRGGQGR